MHKQIGATMLVAGTCIGSGMIALPMMLVKIGLIPAIIMVAVLWAVIYYTCLVSVELNLQAGAGLSLGALGRKFSGKIAEIIGTGSYKVLSFALLAVYIYGGSSVMQQLINSQVDFKIIATIYSLVTILILLLPVKYIDYINRLLFIGLISVISVLIIGLASRISWTNLPLFAPQYTHINIWQAMIPAVFTCFGFQVIFHTLTNYCNKDPHLLKKVFFWGSLIPAIVYIIWTISILGVIYQNNSEFYRKMMGSDIEVGVLIQVLGDISNNSFVHVLVWWLSSLAIFTSVVGVGLALCESITDMLPIKNRALSVVTTVSPAYVVAILVPNAFLAVLGFAGMILVVIAILLPVYLLTRLKNKKLHYAELNNNKLLFISVVIGIAIMLCEILNILKVNV